MVKKNVGTDDSLRKRGYDTDNPESLDSGDGPDEEKDARRKGSDSNAANADRNGNKAGHSGSARTGGNHSDSDDASGDVGDSRNNGKDVSGMFDKDSPVGNRDRSVGGDGNPLDDLSDGVDKGPSAGKFVGNKLAGFGNGFKTLALGGIPGVGRSIAAGAAKAGGGVVTAAKTVTSKVANTLGVPQRAAGILLAVTLTGVSVGGGLVFSDYQYQQKMMTQEMVLSDDCDEDIEAAKSVAQVDGEDQGEVNAAKCWAVMKALGMTDEQASGVLGNMEGESGLSPYTMECDFLTAPDEKWCIGPKKQSFLNDLNAWTLNFVFPYYKISLNKAFYGTSRHGYVGGVGLFGFTGCHYDALEDWAAGLGTTWYDEEKAFDVQLSFSIAPGANGGFGGPGGASDWLVAWGSDTSGCGSPAAAATVFCTKFEGNTISEQKIKAAEKWYAKFRGTNGDESYADSILEMAQSTAGTAAGANVKSAEEDCGVEESSVDNGDLAVAAVAYAYKTTAEGRGNDGTELYRWLHEQIFPGDRYFQSCDRSVATAVRWSDADDDFPAGPCTTIMSHCNTDSDHWEYVGKGVSVQDAGELQPGDVCVCSGHVVIYVGNELIKEKYPDADSSSDFVSGSLNERSPGCGHVSFHSDTRDYNVYRLKHYDEDGIYKDIAEGQSLDGTRY